MSNIYVTKVFMPPFQEYQAYLDKIWQSNQITNEGPLLKEFEEKCRSLLGVANFNFVTNGTLALQLALRALDITDGEIITTPFSYVATTSAILWEHCKPIYVDIKPDTFCIDEEKIEAAVTPNTKAIMPVHVFGQACNVEAIDAIARKHNLKVIYDGAHAFGVTYKGKSLLSYGDISICSFHATKPFHTIEGGCLIAKDKNISDKVDLLKRFGHDNDNHLMLGINAKANEFSAAMGLCNLKYVDKIIKAREKVSRQYDQLLQGFDHVDHGDEYNYSYYPLLLKDSTQLQTVLSALNSENIYPRRYFYPSLNQLAYLKSAQSCPISEDIAARILCLPLYDSLLSKDVKRIAETILSVV